MVVLDVTAGTGTEQDRASGALQRGGEDLRQTLRVGPDEQRQRQRLGAGHVLTRHLYRQGLRGRVHLAQGSVAEHGEHFLERPAAPQRRDAQIEDQPPQGRLLGHEGEGLCHFRDQRGGRLPWQQQIADVGLREHRVAHPVGTLGQLHAASGDRDLARLFVRRAHAEVHHRTGRSANPRDHALAFFAAHRDTIHRQQAVVIPQSRLGGRRAGQHGQQNDPRPRVRAERDVGADPLVGAGVGGLQIDALVARLPDRGVGGQLGDHVPHHVGKLGAAQQTQYLGAVAALQVVPRHRVMLAVDVVFAQRTDQLVEGTKLNAEQGLGVVAALLTAGDLLLLGHRERCLFRRWLVARTAPGDQQHCGPESEHGGGRPGGGGHGSGG